MLPDELFPSWGVGPVGRKHYVRLLGFLCAGRLAHHAQSFANHRLLGGLGRLDARRHGLRHLCAGLESGADRVVAEVGNQSHAGQRGICGIGAVRAVPHRMGAVADLGPDRRPLRPHARAGGNHLRLCRVHWSSGAVAKRVAVGAIPPAGGDRHWRRVGAGRDLRRRSLAGRPSQDGRRLPANRLLRGILPRVRAQLYGGRALRLACHVLVWTDAGHRGLHRAAAGEGAGTLGEKT